MPLEQGNNSTAIGRNIEIEENAGKSHAQAVAIALHTAKDAEVVTPPQMSLAEINQRNRGLWNHDWKDEESKEVKDAEVGSLEVKEVNPTYATVEGDRGHGMEIIHREHGAGAYSRAIAWAKANK